MGIVYCLRQDSENRVRADVAGASGLFIWSAMRVDHVVVA